MQDTEGLLMARILPPLRLNATGIGGLPHTDSRVACEAVLSFFPEIPYVPTLPLRGIKESIVYTDSEPLPGRVMEKGKMWVNTTLNHSAGMEKIFLDYLQGDFSGYAPGEEYASGFYEMMKHDLSGALLVKCQVTGPVTFGMQVVDQDKRPIYYDPGYADLLGKMIALRAGWYESAIREMTGISETLIVLNEPYLAALGSSVIPIDDEMVRSNFQDIASILGGGVGIHCCSNTDWGFLMSLSPGLISFDAYTNAREFLLYGEELSAYLERGGTVAWGIVPAEYEVFSTETVDSLLARMDSIRSEVCELVEEETYFSRSLITPTCGIRFADERGADAIMAATRELSRRVQDEWA
jgi:hypothetical protein